MPAARGSVQTNRLAHETLNAARWCGHERVMTDVRNHSCWLIGALCALLALALPCAARAQEAVDGGVAAPEAVPEPVLIPPELLEGALPEYPSGASGSASVLLELTLDAQGVVVDAKVLESAGAEFDAAAVAAAGRLRFAPAMREGVGIAAVIEFRFE